MFKGFFIIIGQIHWYVLVRVACMCSQQRQEAGLNRFLNRVTLVCPANVFYSGYVITQVLSIHTAYVVYIAQVCAVC
jgi:hypothetical protein